MSVLQAIATHSMLAFAAVVFALQWIAREIGYQLGRRRAEAEAASDGVGLVVTSMLGLLAFVLGLSLAYANTRFQERRAETLAEAQAIGTAWLRAAAVSQPEGEEIRRRLESYARLRHDYLQLPNDLSALERVNAQTSTMQAEIWALAVAAAGKRPDPIHAALMSALNQAFDEATGQRYAFSSGPAGQLVLLLLGMTAVSMAAVGYLFGLRRRPLRVMTSLLLGMLTAVLVVIIDLGAPRLGGIRTDSGPFLWTIESFAPPPPPR